MFHISFLACLNSELGICSHSGWGTVAGPRKALLWTKKRMNGIRLSALLSHQQFNMHSFTILQVICPLCVPRYDPRAAAKCLVRGHNICHRKILHFI